MPPAFTWPLIATAGTPPSIPDVSHNRTSRATALSAAADVMHASSRDTSMPARASAGRTPASVARDGGRSR